MSDPAHPLSDPVEEATRLIAAATKANLIMRSIGGVAFSMQSPGGRPRLSRTLKDVDLVVPRGASKATTGLVEGMGYVSDEMFNAVRGATRLLFVDGENGRHLDVFVGGFSLCHKIPVADRLERHHLTIPREELMLTKLQIVKLTETDRIDIVNLLVCHPVVEGESADGIDASFIAGLCAADWGLWRTTTTNIQRVAEYLDVASLSADERGRVKAGLGMLSRAIDAGPKGRKWRLRSRVGDRVRWYDEPSEED